MSLDFRGAMAARGYVGASANASRLNVLAATALGVSIGVLGSTQPSSAQSAPACAPGQFSGTPPNGTVDLQGASCTLPQAAYPTAANSSGTTITNSGAASATLFQGTAGVTEVFAGRVIDGSSPTGIGLTAGTLQVNQSPTSGYANTSSGPTLIQGGTLMAGAANVFSPYSPMTIFGGGIVDLGGYQETVSSIALQGGTIQNGSIIGPPTGAFSLVQAPVAITSLGGTINGIGGTPSVVATSGATTVTGANNYTGATTVNGGTLTVATGASIGGTSTLTVNGGTFSNAGTTTVTGATTVGATGTLLSAGQLNTASVTNGGILTITGSLFINAGLTNTGTFTVNNGGFYQIQNPSAINNSGTYNADINTNGITVNNNKGGFWNGSLTSTGNVTTTNNVGAVWLGDATVSTGTVVNAGTWTTKSAGFMNAASFTTSGVLDVTNGGLTNSGTTTASGTIIGAVTNTGAFNVTGPLAGIATFSQLGGTLNLGSSTLSASSPVNLSGGTISNGSIIGPGNTINAILSSGGAISNVSNTALVALSGNTTVQGGSFPALYTAQGSTVTASGGLSFSGASGTGGVGTINGNVSLGNGATIAPGTFAAVATTSGYAVSNTGPGTLTLNGNVTFGSGSTLQIAATPTQASLLAVNGTATLGGGSVFIAASGSFPQPTTQGITYKILSASQGVTGTFGSATTGTNYAFLTPSLSYDANDAFVTLNRNNTQLVQVVSTPNTSAVATALVTSGQGSRLLNAFTGLTAPQAQVAANAISGQPNASTQTAGQASTQVFTNFISDRNAPGDSGNGAGVQVSTGAPAGATQYAALEKARPSPIVVAMAPVAPVYRVFATGFGGANYTGSQNGGAIASENGTFYGGLMGLDYRVQPDLLIGAAVGGSTTSFVTPALASSGNTTGFNASVFSVASFGSFYGQSLTTFSTFSNNTARNIAGFGMIPSALEKASFSSNEIRTRVEFGRVVPIDFYDIQNFKITPFTALEIAQLRTSGYGEFNALNADNTFSLSTAGRTYADVKSFLGARLEATYDIGGGMTLRPIVRLAYVHSFSGAPTITNTFQSVPAATFTVTGSSVAHNSAETKAGVELGLGHNTVIFANFEGNFSTVEQIYGGRGGIRYSW